MQQPAEYDDQKYLRRALGAAVESVERGGRPFAAFIVFGGRPLPTHFDEVNAASRLVTCAEVLAIRHALAHFGTHSLASGTLYCSCEPCERCRKAAAWAGLSRVVFARKRLSAVRFGFEDLQNAAVADRAIGDGAVELVHVPLPEGAKPFDDFARRSMPGAR